MKQHPVLRIKVNRLSPRHDHVVTNALLRVEHVNGLLPPPFEKLGMGKDFWVLELGPYEPKMTLGKWQAKAIPMLRRHIRLLRRQCKSGALCFLHVQTESPTPIFPAYFQPNVITFLSQIEGSLEHGSA